MKIMPRIDGVSSNTLVERILCRPRAFTILMWLGLLETGDFTSVTCMDLTPYRGRGAVLYTYKIKDAQRNDVYAHLIVLNNEIIGGDITAISVTDGYELPLIKR